MTGKISKTTVTQIVTANPVNPTVANAPHTDLDSNFDKILSYINEGSFGSFEYDSANSSGLTLALTSGRVRKDNSITIIGAGTVSLAASKTNYVEVDLATMTVRVNSSGFTTQNIPLWLIVTGTNSITSVTDKRSIFVSTKASDLPFSSAEYNSTNVHDALEEVIESVASITGTELVKYIPETDFKSSLNQYLKTTKADAYQSKHKRAFHLMPVSSAGGWPDTGVVVSNWTATDTATQMFVSLSNDVQIREVHTASYPNWSNLARISLSGADIKLSSSNYTSNNVKDGLDEAAGKINTAVATESSHYTTTTNSITSINGQIQTINTVTFPKYAPISDIVLPYNYYSASTQPPGYASNHKRTVTIMEVSPTSGWPVTGRIMSLWTDANGNCTQIASGDGGGEVFTRTSNSASKTWTAWNRVWTALSDGAGSGLDADLLDGHDSSYFFPKSGGTINGGIGIQGAPVSLSISIGDNDTGINWVTDGRIQVWTNGGVAADIYSNTFHFTNRPYVGGGYTIINTDFDNVRAENGYTRLPNGLIFQWGKTPGDGVYNLPMAFPNAGLSCYISSEGGSSDANHHAIWIKFINNAQVQLFSQSWSGPFHYLVIGW